MTKLFVTVTGAGAVVEKIGTLTTGMVGVPVACSFDESWDGLNRLAVFRCGEIKKDNGLKDDCTQVPHEVLTQPHQMLYIGFEGRSKSGDVVIPTIWAEACKVMPGAQASGDPALAPTPSQFDRFMEELAQAEERVQKAVAIPNWNAQEGEAGYIANRPFGEKTAITQLLPMTTVTHFGSANDADLPTFQILPGETYLVSFNGAEYELVAKGFPNNTGAFVGDMLRQTLPFAIVHTYANAQDDAMTWLNVAEGITEAALAVSHKQILEIRKLDPKYLPDSIGGGESGEDGFSPVAQVTQTDTGAVITITDKTGTTTATVTNGKDGKDGRNGTDGKDGAPGKDGEPGAKGDKGDKGDQGIQGEPGAKGDKGDKGDQGIQGIQGIQGEPGKDGSNGQNGKDGTSVTVKSVSESTADGGSNVVTFSDGKTVTIKNGGKGSKGDKGDTGATGPAYTLTAADKAEMVSTVIAALPDTTGVGY